MNRCLVCDQPIPAQSRSDKLTCSASCRTRRYRLAQQQASPKGSWPWRHQLEVLQPVLFVQLETLNQHTHSPKAPHPQLRPGLVPAAYWDNTLEAMNLLWHADDQLDFIQSWPNNQWGAHSNPITGDPSPLGEDVVYSLRGHQHELDRILAKLYTLRGPLERWLAPQRVEFSQRLNQLRGEIRVFAQGVEGIQPRYQILYHPGLIQTTAQFRERVRQWWFVLNDNVE